jgi:hypothetical protein
LRQQQGDERCWCRRVEAEAGRLTEKMDKRPTIVSTFQHTKTATPVVQNAVRAAVLSVAAEALAEDSSMVRWAAIGRHRLAPKVSVSRRL